MEDSGRVIGEACPIKRKRSTRSAASEPPADAEQEAVEEQMLPPNTVPDHEREKAGDGERVYRCSDCGKVFDSYQALGGHRSVRTPTKKISPTAASEDLGGHRKPRKSMKKQARESPSIATNLQGSGHHLHGSFSNGSGGASHGRPKRQFSLDGKSDLLPENLRGLGGIKANQYGIVRFNTNSSSCNMWSGAIECGNGVSFTSSTLDYSSDHRQRWDGGGRKSEPHAIASGHEVSHEFGFLNFEANNDATLQRGSEIRVGLASTNQAQQPHPVNSITTSATTQLHVDQQQEVVGTSSSSEVDLELRLGR